MGEMAPNLACLFQRLRTTGVSIVAGVSVLFLWVIARVRVIIHIGIFTWGDYGGFLDATNSALCTGLRVCM